jgi:16S rRNA G966 N2-methylase RsmD
MTRRVTSKETAIRLGDLYRTPVASGRAGALYNAFSYPTKIDPQTVALFMAAHTRPGDMVLDVFAGSGSTGIAAFLCEQPTAQMKARAEELRLKPQWGPRRVVLYELGVIGSALAATMCAPPEPSEFSREASALLERVKRQYGWMYQVETPDGSVGTLRHAIWSESLKCPACGSIHLYWDVGVTEEPLGLAHQVRCPTCSADSLVDNWERVTELTPDAIAGTSFRQRSRRLVQLYGRSGARTWKRDPAVSDARLYERVMAEPIPDGVPTDPIKWGDLHRAGYHEGITHFHQLYTRRNLVAIAALFAEIQNSPPHLQDALRLMVLSYNAAHSTLMTRVVIKSGGTEFVVTGAQSGVMYISALPVEKNVFAGLGRKVTTFANAFTATFGGKSSVAVHCASSTRLTLPDDSVDYVFTDPPFGDFIPYSEINQVNEVWLGRLTDAREEAIVSPAQGKDVGAYSHLLARVFAEVARVMKPRATATVVFNASRPSVWTALGSAFTSAGLTVERTNLLDKTQVSFKQVVGRDSTRGDALLLLNKGENRRSDLVVADLQSTIKQLRSVHGSDSHPQHLYSRYVSGCIATGNVVAFSASDFFAGMRDSEDLLSARA